MTVKVVGYGSLYRWLKSGERGEQIALEVGDSVQVLLHKLGIPGDEIWMITVNGQKSSLERELNDQDIVRLFSPLGGGS